MTPRVDEVERVVRVWETFGVCHLQFGGALSDIQTFTIIGDRVPGQIAMPCANVPARHHCRKSVPAPTLTSSIFWPL